MSTTTESARKLRRIRRATRIAAVLTAAFAIAPRASIADGTKARTFPSAAAASEALFHAVRDGDQRTVHGILGASDDLASCGDDTRDRGERAMFATKYQEMHRLVREPDHTTILYIGAENWPFPIPLVSSGGRWRFDADAGRREVLFRRIGADEATAMEVARAAIRAAKHEETPESSSDPIVRYAAALVGAPRASTGTTDRATPDDEAFHGYRFVVLQNGGVTIVAYPAQYRSSGVMTFVVGDDGVVYERELGPDSARVARSLKGRPASGWRAVDGGWV